MITPPPRWLGDHLMITAKIMKIRVISNKVTHQAAYKSREGDRIDYMSKKCRPCKGRHTFSLLSPSTFNLWSWVFWFTIQYSLVSGGVLLPFIDLPQLQNLEATTLPTSHFLGDQQVKTTLLSHQAHGSSRDVPKAALRNTDIYLMYYFTNSKKQIPNMHEYKLSCNTSLVQAG